MESAKMKKLIGGLCSLTMVCLCPSIALAATTQAAIANEDDGTVSFVDVDRAEVSATVATSVGSGKDLQQFLVHNAQTSPTGDVVWVTAPPSGHGAGHAHSHEQMGRDEFLLGIAVDTKSIKTRINLGSGLHVAHAVISDDGATAYVTAFEDDSILVVDLRGGRVERKISVKKGSGPHGLRMCAGKLFVANMKGKSLAIIDVNDIKNGPIQYVPLGGMAVQTACSPDGKVAYASLFDTRSIAEYNAETKQLKKYKLPKGAQGPVQIFLGVDGRLWIADQGILLNRPASNNLYSLDPKKGDFKNIKVGYGAHGVAVSDSGDQILVTNASDNTVTLISEKNGDRIMKTISVGKKPNGITFIHKAP
jgi:YVTN family beta-propeller protein